MPRLAITGADGRMGRELIRATLAHPDCALAGAVVRAGHASIGYDAGVLANTEPAGVLVTDNLAVALDGADALIDFTAPDGSLFHAAGCMRQHLPMVIGTTGFTDDQIERLQRTAEKIPLFFSPSMSVGVHCFWHAAAQLAELCGSTYAIAIDEMHHIHKKDAPSGTAKHLHALVTAASGQSPDTISVRSRREGEVVGTHTITFTTVGDEITLTHTAKDRAIFAQGAVQAACWLIGKPAGWYGMHDMLELPHAPSS